MTPAQSFAQSRADAEQLIRQYAPTRLQAASIERLLPAIALTAKRADDDEIPVGASKFGGAPDVPQGFEWPSWDGQPLGFMAQINLEDIAPFDLEGTLPASGILSFFYCANHDFWPRGAADKEGWRVCYFEQDLRRAKEPPALRAWCVTAVISANVVCNMPQSLFWELQEACETWTEAAWEQWEKSLAELYPQKPHLMLGYPREVQSDAREVVSQATERGEASDWHLLLQMDTDAEIGFTWGDGGAIFYLMHRDDLANRDFDKCCLVAQCH